MGKIKISNRELLYLNSGIEAGRKLNGAKYNFATIKTQRYFKNDLDPINAANEPSKDFTEYQNKLYELMKPFALLDGEQPIPVLSGGEVFLKIKPEHEKEFVEKYGILRKKYSLEIKRHKEQVEIYNEKVLPGIIDLGVHTIKEEDFPDNFTLGHADGIMPLIEPIKETEKGIVKFTNLYILQYRSFFLSVFSIKEKKFISGMIENLRQLSKLREEILNSKTYTDFFHIYDKQRMKLCEDYASTDIYGNPKVIGNDYDIPNLSAFNSDLDKLKKKYKKIIDAYEEYIKKEVELSMNLIPFESLPKDISGEQMQVIADFVK